MNDDFNSVAKVFIDRLIAQQNDPSFWQVRVEHEQRRAEMLENARGLAQMEADSLREMVELAVAALLEIRDTYGHVCEEFEICQHVACNDSCGAWMTANEALHDIIGEPHDDHN